MNFQAAHRRRRRFKTSGDQLFRMQLSNFASGAPHLRRHSSLLGSAEPLVSKHVSHIRTSESLILNHFANSNYQRPTKRSPGGVPKKCWNVSAVGGLSGTPLAPLSYAPRQSGSISKRTDSGSRIGCVHLMRYQHVALEEFRAVTSSLIPASFPHLRRFDRVGTDTNANSCMRIRCLSRRSAPPGCASRFALVGDLHTIAPGEGVDETTAFDADRVLLPTSPK
jgi:hypothetical protein